MRARFALTALLLLPRIPATAEVVDSAASGFTVRTAMAIQAAPEDVYRRLLHNVGDWWDSAHTFSGDAHNLSMEEKVGGCFCEKLPNQGGARHMEIARLEPGKTIVLIGGLGPLQSMAATGSMTIQFSAIPDGMKLEVVYAVTGYLPKGMNTLALPVDMVLTQQFTRLKDYIEHGNATYKKPSAAP